MVQYVQKADLPEEVRPAELEKVGRPMLGEKRQAEDNLSDTEPMSL